MNTVALKPHISAATAKSAGGQVRVFKGRNLNRLDRISPPFIANVIFDPECSMWVATCDELRVVTEAPSYEAVTKRFWEIAPEIAADNGIPFTQDSRVQFRQVSTGYSHNQIAL